MEVTKGANKILFINTLAFTFCFAAWLLNGILVTFLADNQVFNWNAVQIGWLIGIPVLTGAIFRLPAGILTDKFGGKPVFAGLLLLSAIPMYLLSYANGFWSFAFCSLGFGITGASFAVGIAFSSIWFPKERQGVALGIFGAGNAGAAITTFIGPKLLNYLTEGKTQLEGWRTMPKMYAAFLVIMAIIFFLTTTNKKPISSTKSLNGMLQPLKSVRVWRFGLYYFLVFGCFVAFAGWLVPYYTNVYALDLATAGLLASCFSLPSGVIRAFGGWLSDKFGARKVMYGVLGTSMLLSAVLVIPKMDIYAAGRGIMAKNSGVVEEVSSEFIQVNNYTYQLKQHDDKLAYIDDTFQFFPVKESWQEVRVKKGDVVNKKELLAEGRTHIYFQANVWVFAIIAIIIGSVWGIGKAAVYKHIPDYFPDEVGVVGGMVGVLGGLGGFFCPILFGYLLEGTGLWSSCWILMFLLSAICLIWMHRVVQKMTNKATPLLVNKFENNVS
ncbi:MFS transporter [Aestuariibaculum sediminum]|uniref:NarK/NasA family nitrate transporter n=1 Tax=Aestuariibaculum sediminum TaxID=2770637 RepID=A0A8J6UHC8_9FLAO|nr:MFS transporter [Aestuariibaculum sediminum]MBD0832711.1 NarK/NasA family nitrate transporter [Aestuariibaculum sediminum]